jgi:hypothetical protein
MLIYKLKAITVRSDNGSYMLRAKINRSNNISTVLKQYTIMQKRNIALTLYWYNA